MNRVRQLRKQKGISQTVLAKALHVDQSAVSKWERGGYPTLDTAAALADFFGVSVEYLLGQSDVATSKAVRVPVLGRVQAGVPIEAIEEILDWEEIPPEMARTGEYFGLKVKGDSMEPRICEGDVLIVKKQSTADTGNIVIALINGDDATVKKFKRYDKGIMLMPTNPAYEPLIFSDEDIVRLPVEIVGVVVECRQKYII